MRFCKACGSALEFFEFLDGELCSSCQNGTGTPPTSDDSKKKTEDNIGGLKEAVLCCENGKLMVKSPEGWILWSAPSQEEHNIQTVLNRARRILEIRGKRKK